MDALGIVDRDVAEGVVAEGGSLLDEELDDLDLALGSGQMQRSSEIGIKGVDIVALNESGTCLRT